VQAAQIFHISQSAQHFFLQARIFSVKIFKLGKGLRLGNGRLWRLA